MVRFPKMGVQRARKRKEESRSKYVSIAVAFLIVLVIVLGSTMFSDANYSSSAYDYRTRSAEGWSEDVRITERPDAPDREPVIAANGENVHIVWTSVISGRSQVAYTNSSDAGETWSEFQQLSLEAHVSVRPSVAVVGNTTHVVWDDSGGLAASEVRYTRSTDGGITWSEPRFISSDDGNNSQAPKIAVSEDGLNVHVVWVDRRHDEGSVPPRTELYYNSSHDGGDTWTGEVRLTDAPNRVGGQNIATSGSSVHIVWYDERDSITNIYYKKSNTNGTTWEDEVALSDSMNHEGPTDVSVWDGHVHVVWVEDISSDEDIILYRNSTNDGESWSASQTLTGPSVRAWSPRLAVFEDEVHMVWFDGRDGGREIYYKYSGNGGISWGEDTRLTYTDSSTSQVPDIAVDNDKIHVVWHDDRDGIWEVYYKRDPDFINVPEFSNVIIPTVVTITIYVSLIYKTRRERKEDKTSRRKIK